MAFSSIYEIAGSAMTAQTIRLNTVASNMANADVVSGTAAGAYKAKRPVFASVMMDISHGAQGTKVAVQDVVESNEPALQRYEPSHPEANQDGYVFYSTVNIVEEMADMMSASRNFETNVDVMSRARSMQQGILRLGQTS